MYLPVERTSRRFSLGSYRPLRSWYRCVTADTVYAWPSIVTLSPQWMFCKHAKVPNQKHRDELRHCVIYRVNTGAEKTVITRVAKLKRKLATKLSCFMQINSCDCSCSSSRDEQRTSRGPEQDAVSELCVHVDMITQGCHILTEAKRSFLFREKVLDRDAVNSFLLLP